MHLRPYQEAGVAGIRAAFRQGKRAVMFSMPTGAGKTFTFSYIAEAAAQKGTPTMILVHRKELLLQASNSLDTVGVTHGLISPDFSPSPDQLVHVASIDSVRARIRRGKEYRVGLLIVDEAHHVIQSNKWGEVHQSLGAPLMLGVSATPLRADNVGLGVGHGGLFDALVMGPTVAELIELGNLVKPKIYGEAEKIDISGVTLTSSGDYNSQQLAQIMDKPRIVGDAVEHYRRICPGARTIAFCPNIQFAKNLRDEFNLAGFPFALLVGAPHMTDAERTEVNAGLASGKYVGACTVDLVSEGYDCPVLECCLMLRHTTSTSLYLQQVGRIMRPAPGKTQAICIDHVGNWRRHSMPWMDRDWSVGMEGRKGGRRKKADLEEDFKIIQCKNCFAIYEPAPACPECGTVRPVQARKIEQVAGHLEEITEEMARAAKTQKRQEEREAKSLDELLAIAEKRGYAPSWAYMKWGMRRKRNDRSFSDLLSMDETQGEMTF